MEVKMSAIALRRNAQILSWLVTVPFVGFCLLTLLVVGNIVVQGGRFADVVAIYYLPIFLYMWAIWNLRAALRLIARGAPFGALMPVRLFRAGLGLLTGALFVSFGAPLVRWLAYGNPAFQTFDGSGVTIGVLGAALMIFSALLRQAADMNDELDGIF
jgi:hypothetical protein